MSSFQHHLAPVKLREAGGAGYGHSLDLSFFHVLELFPGNFIGRLGVDVGSQGRAAAEKLPGIMHRLGPYGGQDLIHADRYIAARF